MKIQESAQNYLETILILSQGGKPVRSVDISTELDYAKPSVSIAMKKLRLDGYIDVDKNGFITLTESGQNVAESMYERHLILTNWLVSLGVDKKTATDDACRMEHVISEQSFSAVKKHILG